MAESKGATQDVTSDVDSGLSAAEDDELRQLTWFSMVGQLSDASNERILELRAKDRRAKVRNPRPDPAATRRLSVDTSMHSDTPLRSAPLDAEPPVGPVQFTCPNCGFVQR
jgi:hypothetical protein